MMKNEQRKRLIELINQIRGSEIALHIKYKEVNLMISKSIKEATLTDGAKIKLSLEVQSEADYQDFTNLKTALEDLRKIYDDVVENIFCDDCAEAVKKVIGG